jgi:hypothetical protein
MSETLGKDTPAIDAAAVVAHATGTEPLKTDSAAATPPADPVKDQKEESMASRFAALAKKNKQVDQKERAARDREAALEAREAKIKELEERLNAPKAKKNPIQLLMDEGYTLAEANEFYLNNEMPTAEHKVKNLETRLEKFEREAREKDEKRAADEKSSLEAQNQKVIEEFKVSIGSFIEKNSEKFELVKLYDAKETVFQTIEQYFEQHQKVLSIDEAAQLVEAYLEDELDKATKTKKYQSKYATQKEAKGSEDSNDKDLTHKTLSNTLTSSPSNPLPPPRSDEERRQRAMRV